MHPAIYLTIGEATFLRQGDAELNKKLNAWKAMMNLTVGEPMLITKDENGLLTDFEWDDPECEFDDEPATMRDPPRSTGEVWDDIQE